MSDVFVTTKHYTVPIFVPEEACPNQCVFCNQRKISGIIKIPSHQEVNQTIEEHLKTIPQENSKIEIGFFGGNFTGIPIEEQKGYLEIAAAYVKNKKVSGIRLSTRPDYINTEILDLLKKYHVKTIELGAQSFDKEVLKLSERGHSVNDVINASNQIKEKGFRLGLQMMIGLPGDTLEKSISTTKRIIELQADDTRIYPTLVIQNTKLEDLYKKGSYNPLSLDEAINWTKELFLLFENAGINIIRVGLHPSEGLIQGKDLIAGPYHPSFRELVLTEIWHDLLKKEIETGKSHNITLTIPEKEKNFAIGFKGKNKKWLHDHFSTVKIIQDKNLKNREFYVDYN